MPAPGTSARRYAQAAFEIALEHDNLEAWQDQLRDLADAVDVPGFVDLLDNPKLPLDVKRKLVQDALPEISHETLSLATILIAKGRLGVLARATSEQFDARVDEHRGILQIEVVTAVEMGAGRGQEVTSQLEQATGKQVRVRFRVDPAIVGGMVIHVGDRVLDGSVVTKLRGLRRSLVEQMA